MKLLIAAVLTVLTLTACARTVWTRNSFTQQEFDRESYECERDARQSGYFGDGLIGALNMQNFFDRCMVSMGWSKVKQ